MKDVKTTTADMRSLRKSKSKPFIGLPKYGIQISDKWNIIDDLSYYHVLHIVFGHTMAYNYKPPFMYLEELRSQCFKQIKTKTFVLPEIEYVTVSEIQFQNK
jgi:hypothetical protein